MTMVGDRASATLEHPEERPASGSPTTPRRRRRTSRLALHPGWMIVVASGALLMRATLHQGLNTDVFWQLAAGNWMLTHHTVIRRDVFSYTVHGRPWLAEEWGFEVILAWMVRHVGTSAYWMLSGGTSVLALLVTAVRSRRLGASALWMAALSIPTAFALLLGLAPRPQDLSYLLFAAELLLVTLARRNRKVLLAFPPLFLLWCNVHGSFLAGLGILALETLLAVVAKLAPAIGIPASGSPKRPWRLGISSSLGPLDAAATFVVSALATLANPHGAKLLPYAFHVATAGGLDTIEEWQSPDFHSLVIFVAIALPLLAACLILAAGRVRTELFDLVVFVIFAAATLHAVRFAPYLGVAFAGLAAPWGALQRETIRRTLLTWPGTVAMCAALLVGNHPPVGAPQRAAAPGAAANWLEHRPGRVFSTYAWNDYLISRHIPVFVDGRTDLYFGTKILSTYEAVSALDERPDAVLSRWRVRWVIWPAHSPLSNYLAEDPDWRLVRRFRTGEVFERV